MSVEQFCLKWNNFHSSIVTAFGSLQSSEDLADVTLTCEGNSIKAHKIILSVCSPYFREVFKDNPCSHPIVILKDVLHVDLIAILNFMYQGEVLISQDRLSSFLQTAETLKVLGLVGNTGLKELPANLSSSSNKNFSKTTKINKGSDCIDNVKSIKTAPKLKMNQKLSKTLENIVPKTGNNLENKIAEENIVKVDDIKPEIEDFQSDHNFNDKVDLYENSKSKAQNSLLETALEMKEMQPSILERSLTSAASKSPSLIPYALDNVSVIQETSSESQESMNFSKKSNNIESDKRSLKHKLSETATQPNKGLDFNVDSPCQKSFKMNDDYIKNLEMNMPCLTGDISVVNVRSIQDVQPHHSSQCGNCPHCGKVYSNQSALKYHVRLVHSDLTNMYCCHLCPEAFDYREGYKKHMVEAHSVRN